MKLLSILISISCILLATEYKASISHITPKIKKRMTDGNSWKKGCPVGLENLRYLRISYLDFKGNVQMGEMIVHKDVARSTVNIFKELYLIGYPIRQMKLVSNFKGSDWQSIEADNTSALNCRAITGNKKKWSNHAYGKAIDINPIENPYISRTGRISHKASLTYRIRKHRLSRGIADKAMILKDDRTVKIFKKYGWGWGGNWIPIKDYQHFEHNSAKPSMQ